MSLATGLQDVETKTDYRSMYVVGFMWKCRSESKYINTEEKVVCPWRELSGNVNISS